MPRPRHFLNPIFDTTRRWHLVDADRGVTIATHLATAFDSLTRRRGLLHRPFLEPEEALVLAPCSAVHTFGMRYPLDVVFVRRDGRIRRVAHDVAPRRVALSIGAFAAIELRGGRAQALGLAHGQRLVLADGGPAMPTKVPSPGP